MKKLKRECLWCRNGFEIYKDGLGIRYHHKPDGMPAICPTFGRNNVKGESWQKLRTGLNMRN